MATTMTSEQATALRTMCEVSRRPAKAQLTECETAAWMTAIGRAIDRARQDCGWNVSEFADHVKRDRAQVSRWIAGTERPQFDVLFAVETLRVPIVLRLAALSDALDVATVITVRRMA